LKPPAFSLPATVVALAAAGALPSCSSGSSAPSTSTSPPAASAKACTPGGDGAYTDAAYDELSRYCMVEIANGDIHPLSPRVLAYDIATPLFSDYALKRRTVWVPPGATATYKDDDEIFDFPEGTIFTKSFGFPRDPTKADGPVRWVETRVIVRAHTAWNAVSYLWNDEQTVAKRQPGGAVRAFDVRALDGSVQHAEYLVPSQQQCPKCHGRDAAVVPIGPRANALRARLPGADKDQLAEWASAGILTGVPATPAPPYPAWDDASQPLETRARAYLNGNCAYCHNEKGEARTTGLYLTFTETDPTRIGRCKPPVAAGGATADLRFDVVPGKPDESILLHRMIATEPAIAMPEIGRSVVHAEAVDLIRQWIGAMTGDCSGQ